MRPQGASSVADASPAAASPRLSVRGVAKSYLGTRGRSVDALRDVTFDVGPGEFLCLVGPSGSGKTTLVNLLAGLERPDHGDILIDGAPTGPPGPDRAVLFQEPALFPWMSVRRNVEFAMEVVGVERSERRDVAERWLGRVGLSRAGDAHPHELSSGMRQRAALARALACRPRVLLADEPFAALDAETRETMQQELQEVWSEVGTTFVFVTHNVREAVFLADRVLVLSAPPGTPVAEYRISAPRPRDIEDPLLAKISVDVHEQLRTEVGKVVARETGAPGDLA